MSYGQAKKDDDLVVYDAKDLEMPRARSGGKGPVRPVENTQTPAQIGHPEAWHHPDWEARVTIDVGQVNLVYPFNSWADMWDKRRQFARTCWHEFLGSLILATAVPTMISMTIGPESTGVKAIIHFLFMFAVHYLLYSLRHTIRLPRYLNPMLTVLAWLHKRLGLFIVFIYVCMQYGASALASLILWGLGGSAIPDYSTAFRPISTVAAVFLELTLTAIAGWFYVQTMSLDVHTYQMHTEKNTKIKGFDRLNTLYALVVSIFGAFAFPHGLPYVGNAVLYFGSAINLGFNVPAFPYWAFMVFVYPIGGALLAYAAHLLTWNMNGLTNEQFVKYAREDDELRMAEMASISTKVSFLPK